MRVWNLRLENYKRSLSITNWAETFAAVLSDPGWRDHDVIDLEPGTYPILAPVLIGRPCTIVGTRGSVITGPAGISLVRVTADDVTGREFSVEGAGASFVDASVGIEIVGATASQPVRRTTLERVAVSNQPRSAIRVTYAEGLRVERCELRDGCYEAIALYSSWDAWIDGNEIDGFRSIGTPVSYNENAYGIKLSRGEADSLVTDPRTHHVTVTRNRIRNIPTWEAIDTHGGEDLTITDNQIYGAGRCGIALVGCQDSSGNTPFAPRSITVRGNLIDSMRDDGEAGAGIGIAGGQFQPAVVGSTPAYAEDIIVEGNVVRRHGYADNSNSGAITAVNTRGCRISGNVITRPSPNGVCAYHTNAGLVVGGNTVTDAWTNTGNVTSCGVKISSAGYNTGRIHDLHMVRGDMAASKINRRWISIGDHPENSIRLGTNSGEGAYEYRIYDSGNRAQAYLSSGAAASDIRALLIDDMIAR